MFLERLKGKDPEIRNEDSSMEEISSSNGKSKGHVMFNQNLDEVTQGLDFLKSNFEGLHLTLACVGFDSMVSYLPVIDMFFRFEIESL